MGCMPLESLHPFDYSIYYTDASLGSLREVISALEKVTQLTGLEMKASTLYIQIIKDTEFLIRQERRNLHYGLLGCALSLP